LAVVAFLDHVFAIFGILVELLIDHGGKFLGLFEELCAKVLIDHQTTSRDHL
jgi:hypothetical protein